MKRKHVELCDPEEKLEVEATILADQNFNY